MSALLDIIKQQIQASNRPMGGYLTMAEYMELCLGHPEYGYYNTRDPFGADGDFTTAPEISQMFGEMIGAWLADTWLKMGAPSKITVLECGAGRGTLMADALRATKGVRNDIVGFHEAIDLHFLEMSPVLRKTQEQAIEDSVYSGGATWHTEPESIRVDSPTLILGNEFLDAMPVRQMVCRDTGWFEKIVKIDINDTLCIGEVAVDEEGKSLIPTLLIPPKVGGQLEVSLQLQCILDKLINIVLKQGGSVLFLDYGFNHNVPGDTLQAVKKHEYCNVLDSPGEVDITAHVNFSEISLQAMRKNMTVHGPVSQGDFLNRLGIGARAQILTQAATPEQAGHIQSALQRLTGQNTDAGEMGKLFKAIALSSDPTIDLAGF